VLHGTLFKQNSGRIDQRFPSESQPGSFNDKTLTDKGVEVPPLGTNKAPIKGLDPKPSR